ncbi:LysR family transcriptional regulator [Paraburkholderia sp. Ac-20342]|uniref:immunity 52 family protein n=1 Tax=Paraburkholderia sp. Ac-20342 TaxID=2703889 RepID=UPI001981F5B0|nr:immunity 52 family protein [Paraburkholderia sp. Ac-20342]MBN3848729.1 LysR family transcriptional regulator [Paraburkholderia sp. Ac-20342]
MEIRALFRDGSMTSRDYQKMLTVESAVVAAMAARDPAMAYENWRLKGDSLEEANLYPAFKADGEATTAAIAVLTESTREKKARRSYASIWNSAAEDGAGAAISCHVSDSKVLADRLTVDVDAPRVCKSMDDMVDLVRAVIAVLHPQVVTVAPQGYFEKQVFDDKPGVGWMLYLPTVLTVQQVPEARALIPVPGPGKNQTGTIVVSVIDEVFSVENPEHVEIANRIEIRLVDQDLLPTYASI